MSSSLSWIKRARSAALLVLLAAAPAGAQCVSWSNQKSGEGGTPVDVIRACEREIYKARAAGASLTEEQSRQALEARDHLSEIMRAFAPATSGTTVRNMGSPVYSAAQSVLDDPNTKNFLSTLRTGSGTPTGERKTGGENSSRKETDLRSPTIMRDVRHMTPSERVLSEIDQSLGLDRNTTSNDGNASGGGQGVGRSLGSASNGLLGSGVHTGGQVLTGIRAGATHVANAATGSVNPNGTTEERTPPPPPTVQDVRQVEQIVTERYAGNPQAQKLVADQYLKAGGYDDATRVATGLLAQNQNDPAAYTLRAKANALAGHHEEAVADARKALKLQPDNQLASLIVGNRDNLAAAGSKIKNAKLDFGGARAVQALGAGLDGEGAGSGSGGGYTAAGAGWTPGAAAPKVAYTPLPLSMLGQRFYDSAKAKFKVGDNTGALMDATRSVGADPQSPLPLVLRAQIDRALENPQGALDDATRALQLAPQDANALRERALAFMQMGRYDDALRDLKSAMDIDPGSGTSYLYRAMVHEKTARIQDALDDLARAVQLEPALKPVADEMAARLRGSKPGAAASARVGALERKLVRGGAVSLATLLLLFGLLGTAKGRSLVTTTAKRALGGSEATVLDEPAPEVSSGSVLGGVYRIDGELGRGGMGVVYDAFDTALQRRVAIKRLIRTAETTSEDLDRLLQEARTAAKLRHPRLAEIYNVISEGDLFLVFERVDGEPLDRSLLSRVRFSVPETRRILGDIGAAIGFAHAQRIIHRDLKPSNVMREAVGTCKVMDFGIAHQASSAATVLTRTSASGTPPYMAPEQAMGSVSKASDLYAMAVMAYELLLGRRPFQGPDFLEQKLNRSFAAPSSIDPALPKGLDAFFAQALDPDPTKRPPSADEFLARFDRAVAS